MESEMEKYVENITEGYIDVPGGKVWYRRKGIPDKTPLIVLHGGPGYPSDYFEPLQELGDEREVILYDQLGCGKSDRPVDKNLWKLDRFVDEVGEVVSSLGLKEYHLLGHSWGSALGTSFALEKPKGLKSLVLSGPYLSTSVWEKDAAKLVKTLPQNIQNFINEDQAVGVSRSEEYEKAMDAYYKNFVFGRDLTSTEHEMVERGKNDDVYEAMWGKHETSITGNLKDFDLTGRLKEITQPVFLICGRFDEATPESTEHFKGLFPKADMTVLEKSAHLSLFTEKITFNKNVREFLGRVDGKMGKNTSLSSVLSK